MALPQKVHFPSFVLDICGELYALQMDLQIARVQRS